MIHIMLAQEFLDLFTEYNPVVIFSVLVTTYLAVKWLYKQVKAAKDWYTSSLKSYHSKENEKEEKEDRTEQRFVAIEEKLDKDYVRIQKSESHLYEMSEHMKDINRKFDDLNNMLIDLRLETMRGRILDFAPLAMDLTHLQSKERYTEIYKVHADYMQLIKQTGKENNFESYNFELIEKSFEQRMINQLFTEDRYSPPLIKKPKDSTNDNADEE